MHVGGQCFCDCVSGLVKTAGARLVDNRALPGEVERQLSPDASEEQCPTGGHSVANPQLVEDICVRGGNLSEDEIRGKDLTEVLCCDWARVDNVVDSKDVPLWLCFVLAGFNDPFVHQVEVVEFFSDLPFPERHDHE